MFRPPSLHLFFFNNIPTLTFDPYPNGPFLHLSHKLLPHRGWHSLIRWTPPKLRPEGTGYEDALIDVFDYYEDSDDEFTRHAPRPKPYQRPPSQILRTAITSPNATADTAWQAFVWARTNPGVLRALSWRDDIMPLFRVLTRSRDWAQTRDRIREVLSSLHIANHGLAEQYYRPLLLSVGQAMTYDGAIEILKEMLSREIRPGNATFCVILKMLLDRRPPDFEGFSKIGTLMDEMKIEPDALTYTQIVRRFVLEGKTHVAEAVLDMLVEKKAPLSESVYNVIIAAYARAGDVAKTFNVLGKMEKSGIGPDGYTYGTLTVLSMQSGDKASAMGFMQRALERESTAVGVYKYLIGWFARAGETERAEGFLRDAVGRRMWLGRSVWGTLLNALRNNGDKEGEKRVWEVIRDMGRIESGRGR